MVKISLFKMGLVSMLFFVFASNVLNYVSIATHVWSEDVVSSIWYGCNFNGQTRGKCFNENPGALIATGTSLNILSLLLIAVAQIAICNKRFRNSISLYFVIGSWVSTLFSLVFNSTGWYFIFLYQYQQTQNKLAFSYGYSFWLMTPVFGTSVIAGLIGAAILGCTCVHNKVERERKDQHQMDKLSAAYHQSNAAPITIVTTTNPSSSTVNASQPANYYPADSNDPQVLRL